MNALDDFFGLDREIWFPAMATGLAVAVSCALLSVLVVLKRLSFIGHGVSHAAFGGIGLAAVLGLSIGGSSSAGGDAALTFGVVAAFCIGAALAIGALSGRQQSGGEAREDTLIGVVLVASMALGAILVTLRARGVLGGGATSAIPSWEDLMFGSIVAVSEGDAARAVLVAAGIALAMWWFRRPLLFWAFDESAAEGFGVPVRGARLALMAMLGVAIVTSMKLAGVILSTALLILPAAIALRVSRRLMTVMGLSLACGAAGVLGGLTAAFKLDLPPGACVVVVLVGLYLLACALDRLMRSATRG